MMFKRELIKKFALVAGSILFSLLLWELVLRGIGFSYTNFYTYDMYTGSKLQSGAEGWYREEGEAYIKINSAGMRDDREIALEKPTGIFRIAVLGDSFVEALQIPTHETFLALMEKKLKTCNAFKGRKVEVLNFGVSGYSTTHELLTLQQRVWPYKPDLVLLEFFAGNDISENSKPILGNAIRPYFTVQREQLLLDNTFSDTTTFKIKSSKLWEWLRATLDHSRIIQLRNKLKNTVGQPLRFPSAQPATNSARQFNLDDNIYMPPTDDRWNDAWSITEKLLTAVFSEVKAHHSEFLLVDITTGIDVHPNLDFQRKYMKEIGVPSLNYPHLRIEKLAVNKGIPLIELQPPFYEYAVKNNTYLHGDTKVGLGFGHWNKTGHALAAEKISARVCADAEAEQKRFPLPLKKVDTLQRHAQPRR